MVMVNQKYSRYQRGGALLPKCKDKKVKLVLKNSRYGPFYSCSNWKR